MTTEVEFEKELLKHGTKFKKIEKNLYEIQTADGLKTISLQNIDKKFARDGDIGAIAQFTSNILQPFAELPDWGAVKNRIYISIEPSDYRGLREVLHKKLSDKVAAVLAYYDEKTNQVRWLSLADVKKLGVREKAAWTQAQENLEQIAHSTNVTFTEIDGQKLGMIEAHEPYKASLILTQTLKLKVSKEIGWPIYAVAPDRDFVYLFSKAGGLMDRLGRTVVREYQESGYPISTEVWELSDKKQTTIGEFPIN